MNVLIRIAGFVLLGLISSGSVATTIYKSVDADGRVTFSDQPPPDEDVVDILEYRDPEPNTSALDRERIEAMREVTDRMAADRREREASRADARAARQQQAQPAYPQPYDYEAGYYGGYPGYYPVRRVRRPHPGLRPPYGPPHVRPPIAHPPIARPPQQSSHPAQPRQAVGFNTHPANLVRRHYTSAARRVFYREPIIGR